MSKQKIKDISLFWALVPIVVMLGLISIGYFVYNVRAEPMILIGTATAAIIARFHGHTWDDTLDSICSKISEALPIILIVASIGFLIGAWMISGTIPIMIYYGLRFIDPSYFYVSAFLLGAFVSVCTGTSWGSMGTVGVALMGIAIGLNMSLPIAAGAVVSGCWFGDKCSPLSDSTNMAALAAGANLYEHIAHLLWTTGPGFIICCVVYSLVGFTSDISAGVESESMLALISDLEQCYNFNIALFLPPIIVLYGSITKRPVIPMLFLSTAVAVVLALTLQNFTLASVGETLVNGFRLSMLPASVNVSTFSPDVARLLERGGAVSMFSSFVTVFSAFSFAGAMSVGGSLKLVINRLTTIVKSTFQLILVTMISTVTICACTSNGTLPLLLSGEAFKEEYRKRGLASTNLSRTLEDSGTVVEPIIPWTASAVYCVAMTGVATLDYLPWAFLCYTGMLFAMLWGATGIGIAKLPKQQLAMQN